MLFRKITKDIREHLTSRSDKILIVEGARQIGKSFIIRYVGESLFENFIELNFAEDKEGPKNFENIHSTQEFYLQLSSLYGNKLGNFDNTLVFLDEIQEYPQYLTLLKFFRQEGKYRFICSGSLLGITLRQTTSIPIGSITLKEMYPLDFEEFMIANGYGKDILEYIAAQFQKQLPLSESIHRRTLDMFKNYLIVGGMPDAVNLFITEANIAKIRDLQKDIINLYKIDASKYDALHRLNIRRIYDMIPSAMENRKKRVRINEIEDKRGARYEKYIEDFEYIISSGIAIPVRAISNPKFPLLESASKNLLKLYLNDVGLLTSILYSTNIKAIKEDIRSINLGAVYETVVAQELKCHNEKLYYYDNKKYGEVDFLIDDYETLSVLPIEVKSGKDYCRHSSLTRFVSTADYGISKGIVLYDGKDVELKNDILYMPVYYVSYLNKQNPQ